MIKANWAEIKSQHSMSDFGLKLFDNLIMIEPVLGKKFSFNSDTSDSL